MSLELVMLSFLPLGHTHVEQCFLVSQCCRHFGLYKSLVKGAALCCVGC